MLSSKQRAKLRAIAADLNTAYQTGKNEPDENFFAQINAGLDAHEIVKIKVLENSQFNVREAADFIAENTASEVAQVIGSKVVLYKKSSKKENRELSEMIEKIKKVNIKD